MHRYHDPNESRHHHPAGGGWSWRSLVLVLLFGAVAGYLATGLYTVQPDEVAAVRRCGRLLDALSGPGLHFGLPYGFDRVDKLKRLQMKRVGVGIGLAERSTGRRLQPQQAEGLTGDRNLILISAIVQYRIGSVRDYLLHTADVSRLIEDTAASTLANVISSMAVDDALTTKRLDVQNSVREQTARALSACQAGVEIVSVSLEGTAAPQEVAAAFADVTSAREDRQRAINEAQGYANRLLPQARGEVEQMRLEAEGYATEVVRRAEGDASRFTQLAQQLNGRRQLTILRLTLETMEEVLPRLDKVVLDGQQQLDLGIFSTEPQETAP